MARPKLPDSERHEREFRVRLKDEDADIILAIAKKRGIAPAILIRSMVKDKISLAIPAIPGGNTIPTRK